MIDINILFITDTHDFINPDSIRKCIEEQKPICVLCLGDVGISDFQIIHNMSELKNIPIGAILGNQDTLSTFDILKSIGIYVADLNAKTFKVENISFFGLSGALRYKDNDSFAFLSHKESVDIMSATPPIDILISHDKPYFGSFSNSPFVQDPHEGLAGLGQYIIEKHPQLHIHGHLHMRYDQINEGGCREICLYQYALVEINEINKEIQCNIVKQEQD